jgi:hypothetical protein
MGNVGLGSESPGMTVWPANRVHGPLLLAGFLGDDQRRVKVKKIQIGKDRRFKLFLHDGTAAAAGISAGFWRPSFNEERATASEIRAMPAFPGMHDHGRASDLGDPCLNSLNNNKELQYTEW